MTNKELDMQACKLFVCPSLNEMDINCKRLGLDDETTERCKSIATEYLKKTYHRPRYTLIKFVIPAFIYIGANLYYIDGVRHIPGQGSYKRKVGLMEIAMLYDVSVATVSKWTKDIISVLEIIRT